jgi:hypothetical protein
MILHQLFEGDSVQARYQQFGWRDRTSNPFYNSKIILCPFKFKLLSIAKHNEENRRYYLRKRGAQLLSRLEHQLIPYAKETNKNEIQNNNRKSIEVDNEESENPSTPKKIKQPAM